MDQQDGYWGTLPSVIMLEIFSYLEHKDRINASMVSVKIPAACYFIAFRHTLSLYQNKHIAYHLRSYLHTYVHFIFFFLHSGL